MDKIKAMKILGMKDGDNLKFCYRRAALRAHPDKGGSAEEMVKVHKAYKYLLAKKSLRKTVSLMDRDPSFRRTVFQNTKARSRKKVIRKVKVIKHKVNDSGDVFAKYFNGNAVVEEDQVEVCLGALLEMEEGLSDWEVDFIERMSKKKQWNNWERKKILEIYDEKG